jgi:hypothetical protein
VLVGSGSGGRLQTFRSLARNRTLLRVLVGYSLFVLSEYSVWIAMLGRPQAWVGYLNFVCGVGALLAATVSAVLVGRRLSAPILGAALALSGALAALAVGLGLTGTVALLMVAGASYTLLDVATRTRCSPNCPRPRSRASRPR